jgi:hypothetical protein
MIWTYQVDGISQQYRIDLCHRLKWVFESSGGRHEIDSPYLHFLKLESDPATIGCATFKD